MTKALLRLLEMVFNAPLNMKFGKQIGEPQGNFADDDFIENLINSSDTLLAASDNASK